MHPLDGFFLFCRDHFLVIRDETEMPCGPTAVHKQPRRPEGISFTNPESPRRTKLGNESGIIPRLCPKVGNESDIIPQLCPKVGNDIPFITHFTKDNHAKTMNDVPPETYKTLYNKKTAQNEGAVEK